jgi:hypothetical protein
VEIGSDGLLYGSGTKPDACHISMHPRGSLIRMVSLAVPETVVVRLLHGSPIIGVMPAEEAPAAGAGLQICRRRHEATLFSGT